MSSSSARKPAAEPPPLRDYWPALILLVALGVRVVYFLMYVNSPYWGVELADQSYYRNWGMQIADSWYGGADGYASSHHPYEQGPLYAWLLGFAYHLGISDGVIIALQMLVGSVVSLLTYSCVRRLFDQRTAIVAGFLAATYGPFIHAECMIMKSFLSPLLTMLALFATLNYQDTNRRWWIVVAGVAVGLACLVTENHVLLIVPIASALWFNNSAAVSSPARPHSFGRRLTPLLILGASCAAMVLPATVRNYAVSRELVAVTAGGGEVFYMAWGPSATGNYEPPPFVRSNPYLEHEDFRHEARRRTGRDLNYSESSRYWFREGLNSIIADPVRAAGLAIKKTIGLFNDFEVPDSEHYQVARELIPILYVLPSFGWLVGVGFVGLVLALRNFRQYQLVIGLFAMHALSIILTYNFGRFRLGMTSIWILFAASGLVWLVRAWRSKASVPHKPLATVAVLLLTAAAWLPSPSVSADTLKKETQKNREALQLLAATKAEAAKLEGDIKEMDDSRSLEFEIGDRYLRIGRFYEAIDHLNRALATGDPYINNPNEVEAAARCRLVDAHQAAGNYAQAFYDLEHVFKKSPTAPELEATLGRFVGRQANLERGQWLRLGEMLETLADRSAKQQKFDIASREIEFAMIAAEEAKADKTVRQRLDSKFVNYKHGQPYD